MSSYWDLSRVSSNCVLFIYNDAFEDDPEVLERVRKASIKCAHVDWLQIRESGDHITNVIGRLLGLDHLPYHEPSSPKQIKQWVPFLDDLIGLSRRELGMAIIVDNADKFLSDNQRMMFDLTEAFLIQFDSWFLNKKPCHLCFQMERNPLVRKYFMDVARTV